MHTRGLVSRDSPSDNELKATVTDFLIWFGQNPWAVWSVLVLLLAVAKSLTLDLTLLIFAAGTPTSDVVASFFPHLLWLQVIVTLTTTVAMLFLLRPTFLGKARRAPGYRSSLDKLISSFGEAVSRITPNSGEVRIDEQIWQVCGYDNTVVIEAGGRIEVYKLDSITLIVYPIAN